MGRHAPTAEVSPKGMSRRRDDSCNLTNVRVVNPLFDAPDLRLGFRGILHEAWQKSTVRMQKLLSKFVAGLLTALKIL